MYSIYQVSLAAGNKFQGEYALVRAPSSSIASEKVRLDLKDFGAETGNMGLEVQGRVSQEEAIRRMLPYQCKDIAESSLRSGLPVYSNFDFSPLRGS